MSGNRHIGFLLLALLICFPELAVGARKKTQRQIGLGFGVATPSPVRNFPHALAAVLEGTYRKPLYGLSIVAMATSSPKIDGTYWFGSNGASKQVLLEPRLYLGVFHAGPSFGLNLTSESDEIRSVASYGGVFGIELALASLSLGADVRYLEWSSYDHPSPLSAVMMLRFRF